MAVEGAFGKKGFLPLARKHVLQAKDWAGSVATDYWLQPQYQFDQTTADSATDPATLVGLVQYGWTTTSLVFNTAAAGADFGSSSDRGTPNQFLTDASGDLLESPTMFGDYGHMYSAMRIAGMKDLPRKLVAEFYGAMTVHSADEPRSGWGFVEDGGSVATEADQIAFISSDGTNFQLGGNAGTPVNGAADDALWHVFKIELRIADQRAYWSIDGVSQGESTATSVAITADEFPVSFGFHALTTNRPALGWAHVYYDW